MSDLKQRLGVVVEAGRELQADDGFQQAAAVAFYASLGIAPTVLLFLSISAMIGPESQEALKSELKSLLGPRAAKPVEAIIENAKQNRGGGLISTVVSIATFLFSASSIFVHLQKSLNKMWDLEPRSNAGLGAWIRKRLSSMGMVLGVLVLLLLSLVATAVAAAAASGIGVAAQWGAGAVTFVLYVVVFGLVFKVLPDARIAWRDVLVGALLTAVLFSVGKRAIGWYLGRAGVGSSYGAAGSLIVLLVWVYYSSIIFFYGAEFTQVWARRFGRRIEPNELAERRE